MMRGMSLPLQHNDTRPLILRASTAVTRRQLAAQSEAFETVLSQGGFQRVLVWSDEPADILRAIDACSRSGCDLWIAHTNIPAASIEDTTRRFGIQLLISNHDQLREALPVETPPARRIHLMTSGTTGSPKIAIHSLESLLSHVLVSAIRPVNRGGRWLLTYQPTSFAGLQVLLTAVLSEGAIVVPEYRTPIGFYEAAYQHNVTHISGTPTFWRSFLLVARPGSLPQLRQITLGGEAIDQSILDRLKTTFPDTRLTHIYASTEAGVVFAVHDGLEGFPAEWLHQPVRGVEIRIRDGVLEVKSPRTMQRYAAGILQPFTEDGWLRTGDDVEVVGNRIRLLGRQDAVINVGGAKVYPQAVESFLLSLKDVSEARVQRIANPISGSLVGAEVVLARGVDADAAHLRILSQCRQGLPLYQVPRILKIVDSIHVQESGKKG
jgi:acyl-coenzyme A synthetase/AMP-(fatty) acid ligase